MVVLFPDEIALSVGVAMTSIYAEGGYLAVHQLGTY